MQIRLATTKKKKNFQQKLAKSLSIYFRWLQGYKLKELISESAIR